MNTARKLALRYAKGKKSIRLVVTDDYFDMRSTHGVDVMCGDERVGYIEGEIHYASLEGIEDFEFSEDIQVLYDLWHGDLRWSSGLPIFEVLHSNLHASCRDMKIGLAMYKELANLVRKEVGEALFFIPNYCHDASTSSDARRVWKSLTRSNRVTSGDVILMVDYKLR